MYHHSISCFYVMINIELDNYCYVSIFHIKRKYLKLVQHLIICSVFHTIYYVRKLKLNNLLFFTKFLELSFTTKNTLPKVIQNELKGHFFGCPVIQLISWRKRHIWLRIGHGAWEYWKNIWCGSFMIWSGSLVVLMLDWSMLESN